MPEQTPDPLASVREQMDKIAKALGVSIYVVSDEDLVTALRAALATADEQVAVLWKAHTEQLRRNMALHDEVVDLEVRCEQRVIDNAGMHDKLRETESEMGGWRFRAEKAERERDEARASRDFYVDAAKARMAERDESRAEVERHRANHNRAMQRAHEAEAALGTVRRETAEEIAKRIEAKYLGPDSGRNPLTGQDAPDAAERAAYDDGLEMAVEVARYAAEAKLARVRQVAQQLTDIPDYTPSHYDQGRVDQRHDDAEALWEVLDGEGGGES